MNYDRFSVDFATNLRQYDCVDRSATNLTELWWDSEKERLFRLWCALENRSFSKSSDYERHRALCAMMTQLTGHPVKRHCRDFLQAHFSISLPINEANCDEIWRMTADALMREPRSVRDLLDDNVRLLQRTDAPSNGIVPILDASLLLELNAPDCKAWQAKGHEILDDYAACGCDTVYLSLGDRYSFVKPNPYSITQVLKTCGRSDEENDLMRSQTLRFLCAECKARGWRIILAAEEACELGLLLSYVQDEVGLPTVYVRAKRMRADMLLFSAMAMSVFPLLCLADYPSDGELEGAIEHYAARYPIDMLSVACGGDPKNRASDRARFNEILNKWREKYD